jgi:predicted Zn-dependent protease with MMP-like domain
MIIPIDKFEQIVTEALDELPERFAARLHNVAVFVEDFPSPDQLDKTQKENKWSLLGLFEGYAQSQRLNYGPVLPDRITIFREPIQRSCDDIDTCRQRIKSVVRHEIAHHFGLDEDGARKAERSSVE